MLPALGKSVKSTREFNKYFFIQQKTLSDCYNASATLMIEMYLSVKNDMLNLHFL